MIVNRPLTPAEQRISQRNCLIYNLINGFSYMCLGETVLILFATNLGCSDVVIAILGSMIYLGFLLLPLGKMMTARSGAANSQANFWVLRNIAALIVAAAAPAAICCSQTLATILLLVGAFLFYGFRAAGVVMSQPLIGEISSKEEQGGFIFRNWFYFYFSGVTALILICLLRKIDTGIWTLFGIVVTGTLFGLASSSFVRRIRESGEIRDIAKRPVLPVFRQCFKQRDIVNLLLAGMSCNTLSIMVISISLLTLKRGHGYSDFAALLYSLAQLGATIVICRVLGKKADAIGSKRIVLSGFYGTLLISFFWLFAPQGINPGFLIIPFLLSPAGGVVTASGLAHYFLQTVEKEQQIAASMLISVVTGAISGCLGSFLSSLLLKLAFFCSGGEGLSVYRWYFAGVLICSPGLAFFVHRLDLKNGTAAK